MARGLHPHAVQPRAADAARHHLRHVRDVDHLGPVRGFHETIREATAQAIRHATGRPGAVSCRFSHAYPDGPAPYFAFHAAGRKGALLGQWQAIKDAVSEALIREGGTITHHHAVGRDHQKWYERQRPALFGEVLAAAKKRLDPLGILNPGVIVR
ncbi:MAG: FAD-linked oxidase C-terminal domain-containing protein [Geminicoccaceae bacterium]